MFGIHATNLIGYDLVCSGMVKVAKVVNLQYLLGNDYCYDYCIQGVNWSFLHTNIPKMFF